MNKEFKKYEKYESQYNEQSLSRKISRFAKKAGLNTIYYVLLLSNLVSLGTLKDCAVAIAALGYFICPIDVIPDLFVGTGFLDDASVLLLALSSLASSITPEIKAEAKKQLHEWFDFEDSELDSKYR